MLLSSRRQEHLQTVVRKEEQFPKKQKGSDLGLCRPAAPNRIVCAQEIMNSVVELEELILKPYVRNFAVPFVKKTCIMQRDMAIPW
jgi:hypothetical protein